MSFPAMQTFKLTMHVTLNTIIIFSNPIETWSDLVTLKFDGCEVENCEECSNLEGTRSSSDDSCDENRDIFLHLFLEC